MLWREYRPVIKIGLKGALDSPIRPIHSAPSSDRVYQRRKTLIVLFNFFNTGSGVTEGESIECLDRKIQIENFQKQFGWFTHGNQNGLKVSRKIKWFDLKNHRRQMVFQKRRQRKPPKQTATMVEIHFDFSQDIHTDFFIKSVFSKNKFKLFSSTRRMAAKTLLVGDSFPTSWGWGCLGCWSDKTRDTIMSLKIVWQSVFVGPELISRWQKQWIRPLCHAFCH